MEIVGDEPRVAGAPAETIAAARFNDGAVEHATPHQPIC
jgi:hypothetical protein